jgi:hypothetical protein
VLAYGNVLGIKCEWWSRFTDSFQFQICVTPKDASGFNKPVRTIENFYYGETTTIDFLEVEYGPPDPTVFLQC